VVLKGAHSIVAHPDGRAVISPHATAVLATAGTGDVLAGAIAGLIAQGVEPFEAAGLAVYLHGAAAEAYTEDYGHSGMLASELGPSLARVAHRLLLER
jgi:NAD(P)H-hydrate epimerase